MPRGYEDIALHVAAGGQRTTRDLNRRRTTSRCEWEAAVLLGWSPPLVDDDVFGFWGALYDDAVEQCARLPSMRGVVVALGILGVCTLGCGGSATTGTHESSSSEPFACEADPGSTLLHDHSGLAAVGGVLMDALAVSQSSVLFFMGNRLMRVPKTGGDVVEVADLSSWGSVSFIAARGEIAYVGLDRSYEGPVGSVVAVSLDGLARPHRMVMSVRD